MGIHKPDDIPDYKPDYISDYKQDHHKSEHHHEHRPDHSPVPGGPCPVTTTKLVPFSNTTTPVFIGPAVTTTIKVPVVLAEPTLQIVVESNIELCPPATEIKRVKKNVFLEQVKLVPVALYTYWND